MISPTANLKADGAKPLALRAPSASEFADWPIGWHVLCASHHLTRSPRAHDLFGRRIVAYRTSSGGVAAMDARCWHMGADLSDGRAIDGDCIRCPFHGWEFGADGRCRNVPSQPAPPAHAAQARFATSEIAGHVFVYPSNRPTHAAPFFDDAESHEMVCAKPFEFRLRCPWWLVSANGFDVQHFLGAHDRRLIATPVISSPHPAARRIVSTFEVVGTSWRDRLTRRVSGAYVTMDVTVWAGSLVFVKARFRSSPDGPFRTTSYGMVELQPAVGQYASDEGTTRVRVTIFVRRRTRVPRLVDVVDARVRRSFIRAFLEADARLLNGARYLPDRLVEADRVLAECLAWLTPVSHGRISNEET